MSGTCKCAEFLFFHSNSFEFLSNSSRIPLFYTSLPCCDNGRKRCFHNCLRARLRKIYARLSSTRLGRAGERSGAQVGAGGRGLLARRARPNESWISVRSDSDRIEINFHFKFAMAAGWGASLAEPRRARVGGGAGPQAARVGGGVGHWPCMGPVRRPVGTLGLRQNVGVNPLTGPVCVRLACSNALVPVHLQNQRGCNLQNQRGCKILEEVAPWLRAWAPRSCTHPTSVPLI